MQVSVSQHDIDFGKPHQSWNCPLARAIQRSLGVIGGHKVEVGSRVVYAQVGEKWGAVSLPEIAYKALERFDGGFEIEPFTFELGEFHDSTVFLSSERARLLKELENV